MLNVFVFIFTKCLYTQKIEIEKIDYVTYSVS